MDLTLKEIIEIVIELKTGDNICDKDFLSYIPPYDCDNDIKEMYKSFCREIADVYADESIRAFIMTVKFNKISKNLINFIENNTILPINKKIDFLTIFDDIITSIRKMDPEYLDKSMNEFEEFRLSCLND